ncbi:MAG: glycosyltransferase [Actinomycetes bacterium]
MARILHLTASNARRGAETFAYELADHLRGAGHEVRVMCVVGADLPNTLPIEIAGTQRRSPRTFRNVLGAARWSDMVVSFGSISLQSAASTTTLARRPFVYRNIGDPAVWGSIPGADLRIGLPLRRARHVVALYPGAADELAQRYRIDPTDITVIPRGVDAEQYQPVDEAERVAARAELGAAPDRRWLLYLGALSSEKDPLAVVELVRRLPVDVGVLVGGAGPMADELAVAAAPFADRIRLLGVIPARTGLAAADALVLPSRTEGIPGAAIEASLSALPVVATDVGGTSSVVLDGTTGRVVAAEDYDAMAEAALDVLDHAEAYGAAARTHCSTQFSMSNVGRRWEGVVDQVTGRSQTAERRVLQVTASTDRRGAEVFAHQLGERLTTRGVQVRTVAVTGEGGSLPFEVLGHGRSDPRGFRALRRAARQSDVVVVHGSLGLWPSALVGALDRTPFIYRNIGDPTYWSTVPFGSVRIGAPLRRAEQVVALSPTIAAWLTTHFGVPADRITVIPNAVDVQAFPAGDPAVRRQVRAGFGIDEHELVFGYLGALSTEKRPRLAIEAVAARPGAHLFLAGDGPLREDLATAARELAPGRIHLLGTVQQPADMLAAVDALLLPSRTEGMPASLIEAALVGAPVVATAVGTVPDLLDELGCGLAVPVDDPGAFVRAVQTFDPSGYDMAAARTAAERFDLTQVVDQWVKVLRGAPPTAERSVEQ